VAWTTPITFVTGQALTAAQLNTYLRDNSNFLFDPPMCCAQATANQTITTSTITDIAFAGADLYDTDTMHNNVTNNTLIAPNTAGVYLFTADVQYAGNATGTRYLNIQFDVGTFIIGNQSELGPSGNPCRLSVSAYRNVVATDIGNPTGQFTASTFQSSGAGLAIQGTTGGPAPCYFSAHWCGPAQ